MAQANNVVVFCLALFLGGVGGMLLPSIYAAAGSSEAGTQTPLDPRPEYAGGLDALITKVDELKELLGARLMESSAAAVRTPVGQQEKQLVLSELHELIASLTELKYQSVRPTMQLSEVAAMQPRGGIQSLFSPLPNSTGEDFNWNKIAEMLTKDHFLWSAYDLVRKYGHPDNIDLKRNTFMFIYDDQDSELEVRFSICEGIVYEVRLAE